MPALGPELPRRTMVDSYVINDIIGIGGFGQIYEVFDRGSRHYRAMKIEYLDAPKQALDEEIEIMRALQDSPFFPRLYATGRTDKFRYLVMELCGPAVSSVRRECPHHHFTPYTYLRLAFHALRCLESLHKRGYLHCDVKPGNWLIRANRHTPLVLIDFGLSKRYRSESGDHLPPSDDPICVGTSRYCSLHAHADMELSRRDDLISWFYSVVEVATGTLPWPNGKESEIVRCKRRISTKKLCAKLPPQFMAIWEMIAHLEYEDDPPYDQIRELIVEAWSDGTIRGHRYDWEGWPKEKWTTFTNRNMDMGDPSGEDVVERAEEGCVLCAVA